MEPFCTLQVFIDAQWQDAATVEMTGSVHHGIDSPVYLAYLPNYALAHWGRVDSAALSANLPVGITHWMPETWPPFLTDLLPQGYGRAELMRQLHLGSHSGPAHDWALLRAGAGNPIGNIRVKEAHAWATERSGSTMHGFTMEEVAARAGDFNEYLAQNGLFLAGSSGIQGEWPKILLTHATDGLLYLDHTLPDAQAVRHYIVKFGRGTDRALADILALEAPYMHLARSLGLHVHAALLQRERALFIPRFDRQVANGQVFRHGQESIASLCGVPGFGAVPSHNEVCRHLGQVATDPARDVIEYIKRDIANIVLGNKDNHARNTAIGRKPDGFIGLTPLFDFAPMWLHPDGIARRMRWQRDDGGSPDWSSVIDQAAEAAHLDASLIRAGVAAMAGPLGTLFEEARAAGIGEQFLKPLERAWRNACVQIEGL
ncbi:serine/threonine-protein kinase HipA [Pseudoduganella lurida]|uniref:Serine/threonine-protein kinase HipA n=1 Tax=Pseudoduganella lurida TaxID=1036180 RepID=A0A562QXT6_9BURK|nr:HipA domain-containing protein [Pseudoduganella lurida]TWI61124.1 serine/threonine-protein kinase HipA [Pseudoduganella lurida]